MTERTRQLRDQRANALANARAIIDRAEQENRNLNQDEQNQYDGYNTEIDTLTARIEREERQTRLESELRDVANHEDNPARRHQPGAQSEQQRDRTESQEYRQGLVRYLASGMVDGEVIADRAGGEMRSILGVSLTGAGATGGILAPTTLERTLLEYVRQQNVMRQLAGVRTSASDIDIPFATNVTQAYHVAEGADFTRSTPKFDKVTIKAHKTGALAVVTHEAMQDIFLDLENWIRDDFGMAFADLEEADFINGSGTNEPRGLLLDAGAGVTAASATAITADELMDLEHSVKQRFRKKGTWLLNDATLRLVRKLKDANGQYMWQPGMQAGAPDVLLGHAVATSDEMPKAAEGTKAIAFGDFSWYRIVDRSGLYLQRLNELYATSGQVGFLAYRRYDARLLSGEAVKVLAMKGN